MAFQDEEEAAFAEQTRDNVEVFSPVPRKPMTMDFYDALKEVSAGKRITKLEWAEKGEPECYVALHEGRLQIYRDGKLYDWLITEGDIAGEDYVNRFHSER